jgi:hypothetical protein
MKKIALRTTSLLLVGFSMPLITGCAPREQRLAMEAQNDHDACSSMGYIRGTELYLRCRQMQTQNRLAKQIRQGNQMQAVGNGLMAAGRALESIDPPSQPRASMSCRVSTWRRDLNNRPVLECE